VIPPTSWFALSSLALVCFLGRPDSISAAQPIPAKTVVLTFDDAVRSHLDVVAPLLKQNGFGATFFISHAWMSDQEHFLAWTNVAQLHRMGFEIGNHSWTHAGFNTPRAASRLAGELGLVEIALNSVGVPKPITFGWTGNAFGPDALAVLERNGYRLARRGMQPEIPYGSLEPGPLFDPTRYHPLLIPSAGDAYPSWTLEQFKRVVDRAVEGRAAIVQFHGVPDVAHPWVHTPEDRFRTYVDYLKQGGFHVIAMRDLLPYLPEEAVKNDPMQRVQYPANPGAGSHWPTEVQQTVEHLEDWLPNMARDHGFTVDEIAQATALPKNSVEERLARLLKEPALAEKKSRVRVRPYPGGRHPRIGFLEGAIDPQRGTKASIFPPWSDGGYVVLDIPEAIFSNLGLLYLAHTHVPTIWDDQNRAIENVDWQREENGGLQSEWHLPNGVSFGARVTPGERGADLDLWLMNGAKTNLTGLRTQICLMLKGAPGFTEQSQERKSYQKPLVVAQAAGADRYLLLAFTHCGRVWGNAKCPCVHSDPVFPDAAPGQRVEVRGRLVFYEGQDVQGESQRLLQSLGLQGSQP